MTYAIALTQLGGQDILTAGGKGANLGELTRAGFPVPAGFVLTTAAYDTFVQDNALQQQIHELAAASADASLSAEETSAAIEKLFLAGSIPEAIRADLSSAYADLTVERDIAVAVRSSATAEDLPTASFAGQQDSYLNIQNEKALFGAVKSCWASLWTPRAIAYRTRQGIDPATVSLAVVVQQLVPAEAAGVLFTANPVDGDRDQIVINATWGLGESIVGGLVTPDTVVVDKTNHQIVSRETGKKSVQTVPSPHGTETQSLPPERQHEPAIDDDTAVYLARFGAQIEAHLGLPVDIEWATAGGEIAILQARPITKLPPAPLRDVRWEPPTPGTVWMRRQVVEHMPEPLSPLFDELYVQNGLDYSMEMLADFMGDLSNVDVHLRDFYDRPFATTVNGYAYSTVSFKFSWKLIPIALRIYLTVLPRILRHLVPRWKDHSVPAYQACTERWKTIDLAQTSDEVLLQGVRELATEDAVYWFAAAAPLGLARMSDAALDRFLKSVTGRRRDAIGAGLTSGAFLRGFPSKSGDAQAQLETLARRIAASDRLREKVLNAPVPRLLDTLAGHPEIMLELRRYLETYGHQIYNLDFVAPTLADDPLPVLLSLKAAITNPERDVLAHQAELARGREDLVARVERSLNPFQRGIFKQLLNWAQRYSPNREEALFYVGSGWPALRRLALELGRRLTEAGSLEIPDDVFYLESTELAKASADRAQGVSRPDLAQLAQERRSLREARKRLEPPVSVPPDARMKWGPIDMAMFEPKPRSTSTGPTLEGHAVSPGLVTAPASVVRSPADFSEMETDTILVCPTTTPAWTPLFALAKGLVTDIGGALAHGSIVAREYGIPAVMGTGFATQRIKNGQLIRVDGHNGTVTLVDEMQPEATRQEVEALDTTPERRLALVMAALGLALGVLLWRRRRWYLSSDSGPHRSLPCAVARDLEAS